MVLAPRCGRSSGCVCSSSASSGYGTATCMSGAYSGRWAFSSQRPERRALERDEVAIEDWKKRIWPGLKKARREGRLIVFIDEGRAFAASHAGSHLGGQGAKSGGAVLLQLGPCLGHCRPDRTGFCFRLYDGSVNGERAWNSSRHSSATCAGPCSSFGTVPSLTAAASCATTSIRPTARS